MDTTAKERRREAKERGQIFKQINFMIIVHPLILSFILQMKGPKIIFFLQIKRFSKLLFSRGIFLGYDIKPNT